MSAVHYDASTSHSFCDAADGTSVTSTDEDEVTCKSCIARLQRMDIMTRRKTPVLLAQRVDWFGDD